MLFVVMWDSDHRWWVTKKRTSHLPMDIATLAPDVRNHLHIRNVIVARAPTRGLARRRHLQRPSPHPDPSRGTRYLAGGIRLSFTLVPLVLSRSIMYGLSLRLETDSPLSSWTL